MKRFKSYYILPVLFIAVFISSCSKSLEDYNKNPNAAEEVTPDLLLPRGIKSAVDLYWGAGGNETLGADVGNLFVQHWARIQYTETDRYAVPPVIIDNSWRDFYTESLADLDEVERLAEEMGHPNYSAVAKILKSWVFSLLTDVYGDVPYSDALKGGEGVLSPSYDNQKDIYAGIINTLQVANDEITSSGFTVGGDILFSGNMNKWRKFANSLSLRLLNRIYGKSDAPIDVAAHINRILSNPGQYPVMESNADIAQLAYLSARPNTNPISVNRISRDDHRVSATLVDYLKASNDVRLTVYANLPEDGGDYKGVPNGLLAGDAYALGLSKTSKVGSYFTATTAPAVLLSFSELLFIKAELALRGISSAGDASTHYTQAIKASHEQYALEASPSFLAPLTLSNVNDQALVQILEQKWVALFGQGIEAWTEQRRTGIPALTAPKDNVNNGIIPTRLPYPLSEEALNETNFRASLNAQEATNNDMRFELWWAK